MTTLSRRGPIKEKGMAGSAGTNRADPCGGRVVLRAPIFGRPMRLRQISRRVDQPHVRERLRKIADQATRDRVVFLAHQAEIVAQGQQKLEQHACFVMTALERVVVRQPERTGRKRTFTGRHPVYRRARVIGGISQDEAVMEQLALDRAHRSDDPRIVRWEESD